MAETVKDFMEEKCRPTAKNKLICRDGEEVTVIDPLQGTEYSDPATEENIENFLERQKAKDVENQPSSNNTKNRNQRQSRSRHSGMAATKLE